MGKLSALTVILIGVSIAIVALSWAFFQEYMPNMKEAEYQRTFADQLQVEADKQPAADRRKATAIEMVDQKAREWQEVVAVKTPPASLEAGGIDISKHSWQLAIDTYKFRNNIQRKLNAQVKKGGVRVLSAPLVPMPATSAPQLLASYYNYPAYPFPILIFDFGAVQVTGTYQQIMDNVRGWSQMPNFLAVADGLQIQGTAPTLTATYNLTVVGYIRGSQVFPPVPEAG